MDCRDKQAMYGDAIKLELDERRMVLNGERWIEDEEDNEQYEQFELPAIFEVCGLCDGRGTHVNPSIDADHGITQEDIAEDPDFFEDYMAGSYDVPCYRCGGKRVEAVPDRKQLSRSEKGRELLRWLEQEERDHWEYVRECEMERRMGC